MRPRFLRLEKKRQSSQTAFHWRDCGGDSGERGGDRSAGRLVQQESSGGPAATVSQAPAPASTQAETPAQPQPSTAEAEPAEDAAALAARRQREKERKAREAKNAENPNRWFDSSRSCEAWREASCGDGDL